MGKQVLETTKVKKTILKKWWFWTIAAVIFFYSIGSSSTENATPSDATTQPVTTDTVQSEQANSQPTSEPEKVVEPEPVKEEYINTAESTELFTGQFLVGTDIKPGRYTITTSSGSGNLFVYDKSSMPVVNEVLSSSLQDSFGLGVTKVETDLVNGQSIEISGLNAVSFEPAVIELRTTLPAGHHLVGRDVPEGSYIATAPQGSGNFFVYGKNGFPNVNEILGKDDFGLAVEKVKFSVKNGEIIHISGLEEVNLQ